MQYFADSTFWIALFNKADANHKAAVSAIEDIGARARGGHPMIFTDYIFDEVVTTLLYRTRRHDRATEAGRMLLASQLARMVTVPRPTFEKAWRLFQSRKDKKWSFTDCTSFTVMKDLGIRAAVSFDGDFRAAGFTTIP